jgi:hypothetical protein
MLYNCTIAVFENLKHCYCRNEVRLLRVAGDLGKNTHDVLVLARLPVCFGGPFQMCGVLLLDDPAGEDNGDSPSGDIALLLRALALPPPFGCKVILGRTAVPFFAPGP